MYTYNFKRPPVKIAAQRKVANSAPVKDFEHEHLNNRSHSHIGVVRIWSSHVTNATPTLSWAASNLSVVGPPRIIPIFSHSVHRAGGNYVCERPSIYWYWHRSSSQKLPMLFPSKGWQLEDVRWRRPTSYMLLMCNKKRRSISRDFSLADHTLPTRPEPAWQKMAQSPLNDTTQPVDSEEEGRSSTMDRQWVIKKNKITTVITALLSLLYWKPHGSSVAIYRLSLLPFGCQEITSKFCKAQSISYLVRFTPQWWPNLRPI